MGVLAAATKTDNAAVLSMLADLLEKRMAVHEAAEDPKASLWCDFDVFCRYVTTEDVDDEGRIRPYPLAFPHVRKLKDFVSGGGKSQRGAILKSRGMFVSTFFCVWFLWRAMAARRKEGRVYTACIISQTERHARLLMRRMLNIYDRLPEPIRRARPLARRSELSVIVEDGGEIQALHAGGEGPRTDGYTDALMDELAFQDNADANWRALLARTRNVYGVSTPNGPGNLFYDLWHGSIEGMGGLKRLSLHYSEHPGRKPGTPEGDEWLARMRAGMPKVDWLREYEMRFDIFAEPGLLSADWSPSLCLKKGLSWEPGALIDLSWDPGFVRGACIVGYENQYTQWCILRVYLGKEENTDDFAHRVCRDVRARWGDATFRMCGDPAAAQRRGIQSATGENTDRDVIERIATAVLADGKYNVRYESDRIPALTRPEGHRMIRRLFKLRGDGRPGLLVNPDTCRLLVEGFEGGYRLVRRRSDASPTDIERERPARTSDHVHVMDAFRYLIVQRTERGALPVSSRSRPRPAMRCVLPSTLERMHSWGTFRHVR